VPRLQPPRPSLAAMEESRSASGSQGQASADPSQCVIATTSQGQAPSDLSQCFAAATSQGPASSWVEWAIVLTSFFVDPQRVWSPPKDPYQRGYCAH
jgi:hypothetical protein